MNQGDFHDPWSKSLTKKNISSVLLYATIKLNDLYLNWRIKKSKVNNNCEINIKVVQYILYCAYMGVINSLIFNFFINKTLKATHLTLVSIVMD